MTRPDFGRAVFALRPDQKADNSLKERLVLLAAVMLFALCQASFAAASLPRAQQRLHTFDLPAQPLTQSLIELGKQTGITIVAPADETRSFSAPAVRGRLSLSEAINILLADTPLGYRFTDSRTLSVAADLPRPQRTAQAPPQEAAPTIEPALPIDTNPIEEVIVTSQRRSQNLQQVPKAISVVNQEQLERARIINLESLAPKVPGLTVSYFSLGQPTIHMRGIGSNDDGAALDNSIIVYLDDVYVSRISVIDLNLLDVERLEVLRGPQGTLYGRNTIGGAINVVSKKPSQEGSIDIRASAGNYDHLSAAAIFNGPLIDHQLLGKLALSAERTDGWQDNIVLNEDQHGRENLSARQRLLYSPNDQLTVELAGDYTWDNMNSTGRIPVVSRVPIRVLDANGQLIPLLDTAGNPRLDSQGNPLFASQLPSEIFRDLGGDFEHATNGLSGYTDRTIWGVTSKITWEAPTYSLESITGYRDSEFAWAEDSLGLPPFATDQRIATIVDETHQQFSQELRWTSNEERSLRYVMGLFFLHEQTQRREVFPFNTGTGITDQDNTTKSFALFGQADYDLSNRHRLTFGARYTHDRKRLEQFARNGGAPAIIFEDFDLTEKKSWDDLSPSIALSYQANENLLLYGSISKGFKSGGFQGAPANLGSARRVIDPEKAWNYEFGIKSELLQNRLRLNLVTFYTDFRDLQVVQFRTFENFGVFETSNATSATLRGLESEFIFHPAPGWRMSGSYAYLRATYDSFHDMSGANFTGNRLRQAPKHSLDLSLSYEWAVLQGMALINIDYRYQDKSYREPDNSVTVQPDYDLVDMQLSYRTHEGDWEATLWSKNLLNEEYIAHLYILGGNDYALFGTPRTYGLTLAWHY